MDLPQTCLCWSLCTPAVVQNPSPAEGREEATARADCALLYAEYSVFNLLLKARDTGPLSRWSARQSTPTKTALSNRLKAAPRRLTKACPVKAPRSPSGTGPQLSHLLFNWL